MGQGMSHLELMQMEVLLEVTLFSMAHRLGSLGKKYKEQLGWGKE